MVDDPSETLRKAEELAGTGGLALVKLPDGPCWGRLVSVRKATRRRAACVVVDLTGVRLDCAPEDIVRLAPLSGPPAREG